MVVNTDQSGRIRSLDQMQSPIFKICFRKANQLGIRREADEQLEMRAYAKISAKQYCHRQYAKIKKYVADLRSLEGVRRAKEIFNRVGRVMIKQMDSMLS